MLTVAALAAAAWLFLADGGAPEGTTTSPTTTEPERDQAEGVLDLPDDEEPTDNRRRGEQGRARSEDEGQRTSTAVDGEDDGGDAQDTDLPAIAANLDGRRVAIGSASAPVPGNPARRVKVGDLRLRCGAAVDQDRAAREDAVLARLSELVERAGGRVVRVSDPPACVDGRARRLGSAQLGLVLEAGDATLVAPGRATRGAGDPASMILARELATALDAKVAVGAQLRQARRSATAGGGIDLPGGAAVAWVEFDGGLEPAEVEALASTLLQGLAATAARADVSPG